MPPPQAHKYACLCQESTKQNFMYDHVVNLKRHINLNMTILIMQIVV